MDFASDNIVGASEPVVAELAQAARAGVEGTYGTDRWTRDAAAQLEEIFERKLFISLVPTGTAANALSLGTLAPPWGAVFCHANAHVIDDECGAPEFFTAGAKLVGIPGAGGKLAPAALRDTLRRFPRGVVRQVQPAALSLSQATEAGTVYTPDEVAALAAVAHDADMPVHMDGARFANALVALGCTPAELTWKAGVDALSFGATKNGALACEAVILFDPDRAETVAFQRKRAGHTLSKGRILGAQMAAYLRDGHWLELAQHANRMARRLADGLANLPGVALPWPCEANEVFVKLPAELDAALRDAGAHYYPWDETTLEPAYRPGPEEVFIRLICSYETSEEAVESFLRTAAQGRGPVASSPQ